MLLVTRDFKPLFGVNLLRSCQQPPSRPVGIFIALEFLPRNPEQLLGHSWDLEALLSFLHLTYVRHNDGIEEINSSRKWKLIQAESDNSSRSSPQENPTDLFLSPSIFIPVSRSQFHWSEVSKKIYPTARKELKNNYVWQERAFETRVEDKTQTSANNFNQMVKVALVDPR